jgi:hypothetical protein
MKKPEKKGDYVVVQGQLWRVTTAAESRRGAAALTLAGRAFADITHWDGSQWHETGTVLHASK